MNLWNTTLSTLRITTTFLILSDPIFWKGTRTILWIYTLHPCCYSSNPGKTFCRISRKLTKSRKDAFERWIATISCATRRMMDKIQYYYECQHTDSQCQPDEVEHTPTEVDYPVNLDSNEEVDEQSVIIAEIYHPLSLEQIHGEIAIEIAEQLRIFPVWDLSTPMFSTFPAIRSATDQDIQALDKWKVDFDHPRKKKKKKSHLQHLPSIAMTLPIPMFSMSNVKKRNSAELLASPGNYVQCIDEEVLLPEQFLKVNQLHAFKIIVWHLEETLAGGKLQLIVNGEVWGGTGKSKLIEAITDYFSARGATYLLIKMAYTGIADSHIQGITCHAATMISRSDKVMSNRTKSKL